jgi:hypothetical protein
MMTKNQLLADLFDIPTIDGHMWLVRNGKIFDPHFTEYDVIAKIRGVSSKKNYAPAPKEIQEEVIENWTDFLKNVNLKNWKNEASFCFYNAFAMKRKYGGELVFGSMGFGEGKNVWWEYGGEKWDRIEYFLKMTTPPEESESEEEEEKQTCCVCLDDFSKMSFCCETCKEGLVCKKCVKKLKGVSSCPVCRTKN